MYKEHGKHPKEAMFYLVLNCTSKEALLTFVCCFFINSACSSSSCFLDVGSWYHQSNILVLGLQWVKWSLSVRLCLEWDCSWSTNQFRCGQCSWDVGLPHQQWNNAVSPLATLPSLHWITHSLHFHKLDRLYFFLSSISDMFASLVYLHWRQSALHLLSH